jgi:hypothetical protein
MLCRKVAIHDEGPDELIPLKALREISGVETIMTYEVYRSFQSAGRLIPGWGHAGQNIAIDPSLGGWSS